MAIILRHVIIDTLSWRAISTLQTGSGICGNTTVPFARPGTCSRVLCREGNQIRETRRSEQGWERGRGRTGTRRRWGRGRDGDGGGNETVMGAGTGLGWEQGREQEQRLVRRRERGLERKQERGLERRRERERE